MVVGLLAGRRQGVFVVGLVVGLLAERRRGRILSSGLLSGYWGRGGRGGRENVVGLVVDHRLGGRHAFHCGDFATVKPDGLS